MSECHHTRSVPANSPKLKSALSVTAEESHTRGWHAHTRCCHPHTPSSSSSRSVWLWPDTQTLAAELIILANALRLQYLLFKYKPSAWCSYMLFLESTSAWWCLCVALFWRITMFCCGQEKMKRGSAQRLVSSFRSFNGFGVYQACAIPYFQV